VCMARARTAARRELSTLTTTEAAVLALLEIEGERSGYDLLKLVSKAIGHVWAPARSRLYAVLPRLVDQGLADGRVVHQTHRPDKQLYRITDAGRESLRAWLEEVEPDAGAGFYLRLFVGGLSSRETLVRQVEHYRDRRRRDLEVLREIEPTNTRRGHDYYHYFLLRYGIERAELDLRWAGDVLRELEGAE
jgi:DNA-binding PadR family transcriptional regulator